MPGTSFDSAQPLRIEMQHVARRRMFVSMNRGRWFEQSQSSHSCSSAHASYGRHATIDPPRDLTHRHSLPAELDDSRPLLLSDLIGLMFRLRAAVLERLVFLRSSPPLTRTSDAQASRICGRP
jgi:hypothetical protein